MNLVRKVSGRVHSAQLRLRQIISARDDLGGRVDRHLPDIVVSQPNERHLRIKRATCGREFAKKLAQFALELTEGNILDTSGEQTERQQNKKRLMRRALALALPDIQMRETLKNFRKTGGAH
ncbi:hypothetical protein LY284_12595 [Caballeronia sp. PC1]|nr:MULTISPECIES: hypothetical protein [unclassified Caballeronia]MCE4543234.1 hypothetical protein [Caballeronia sp. PC1]MCE4567711.1 hypothetical protein [Caballeronia sp. CLC5]